jgi:hypothetical protein
MAPFPQAYLQVGGDEGTGPPSLLGDLPTWGKGLQGCPQSRSSTVVIEVMAPPQSETPSLRR